MKKVLFAFCLVSLLFACLTFASAAGDKIWDFTTASGMAEWSPNGSVAYQITEKGTVFSATANDKDNMQLNYKGGTIQLDDYAVFAIEYDNASVADGRRIQFYHWPEGCSGAPRIDIPINSGYQMVSFDMKNSPPATATWTGSLSKIRFDPIRGAGERSITIKMMGLFESNESFNAYVKAKNPELFNKPGYVTEPGTKNYTFGYAISKATVDIDYVNGYAIVTSTDGPEDGGNGDCNLSEKVNFDADTYPWIKMRIRNLSDAEVFEMHFACTGTNQKITAESCTHFPISARDEDFKEYVFNVKDYNVKSMQVNGFDLKESVWDGNVSIVRYDCMWLAEPSGQMPTGSQMYIDYIAFLSDEETAKAYQPEVVEHTVINSGKENPTVILKTEEDIEKWNCGQLKHNFEAGLIKLNPTGSDPTMSYGFADPIDTEEFKYFAMHYNIKSKVNVGGLFYTTDKLIELTDASYSGFSINNRGEWSDVIVDLSSYPKKNWNGKCTTIRLDPINGNDTDATIMIERLGFFRSIEEASAFLAQANTDPDYSLGATFSDTLQRALVAPGALYDGYDKSEFMLSSTEPQGTSDGNAPVVIYTDKEGKTSVVALGFTNSYGYTTFSPNKPGTYTLGYNHKNYTDISGHWGEEYINFVSDRTLFGGTSPTEFSPETAMTRGMFITVLGRMHGVDTAKYDGNTGYGDVPATEYYAPYIQWAKEYGIMGGTSEGVFAPEEPIYRETMALVISDYINAFGYDFTSFNDVIEFNDISACDARTVEAIKNAQTAGIINGKGEGKFDPKGVSTRAEVATVMERTIKSILGVSKVTTEFTPDYFQRKRIRLGVWGFEPSQATKKGMDYLKDLGMDLIVTGGATTSSNKDYVFNYADKHGIEVFVTDSPVAPSKESGFDYRKFVAEYAEHPSFSGNFIIDEPGTDSYPELAKVSNDYMKALPGKIPFTNLLPMYANAAQLKMGAGASKIDYYDSDPNLYRKYCQQWFEQFDCDYICTDIYPLQWVGTAREAANKATYNEYIESINQIATVAREANKEFWCCIQTFGWTASVRTPNEAEYRWQCYSMLSFGCTGILLWRYMSSDASLIKASTLEPTQAYFDCQPVMWEMRKISDVFVQYKNLGAFTVHSEKAPYLRMSGEYKDFAPIASVECNDPLLVGCFEKEDGSGAHAFTLVNMNEFSSGKETVVKVKLNDASKTVTSYYRGEPVTVTPVDGYYTFELENGDGVFVTIE
ncbi:MAG: S-layer homology domain-containing protein [Clostridia bacterium]|nr:S-layer homology domain-containing protein [Clostridia bacterium]